MALLALQEFLVIKLMSCDQCFQTRFSKIEFYRVHGVLLWLIQYRRTFYSYSLLGPFEREQKNDYNMINATLILKNLKLQQDVYAEHYSL